MAGLKADMMVAQLDVAWVGQRVEQLAARKDLQKVVLTVDSWVDQKAATWVAL